MAKHFGQVSKTAKRQKTLLKLAKQHDISIKWPNQYNGVYFNVLSRLSTELSTKDIQISFC